MKTVFLGGTCNGSNWRNILLLALNTSVVSAYNPVVADWTPECQAEEIRQRESSDYCLYVITPKMMGSYSIAEVVEDSVKRPGKTLLLILNQDGEDVFNPAQTKSLQQVGKMVEANGGRWFQTKADLVFFLNNAVVPTHTVVGFEGKGIDFGHVLAAAKHGKLIAREGWNGKNMFVFQRPADELSAEFIIDRVKSLPQALKDYYVGQFAHTATEAQKGKSPADTLVKFTAYLCLKAADGSIVNGWLPSQTDLQATDWRILD